MFLLFDYSVFFVRKKICLQQSRLVSKETAITTNNRKNLKITNMQPGIKAVTVNIHGVPFLRLS